MEDSQTADFNMMKRQMEFFRNQLYQNRIKEISGSVYLYELEKGDNTNNNNLGAIKIPGAHEFIKVGRVSKDENKDARHAWYEQRFESIEVLERCDRVYDVKSCEKELKDAFKKKWKIAMGCEFFETQNSVELRKMRDLFVIITSKYTTPPSIEEICPYMNLDE
jgi:hypothetical protein